MARRRDPETGLTQQQEKFCVLYVTGGKTGDKKLIGNGSACYREAFNPKKATDKSINELASRLMADVKMASRLKTLREQVAEKAVITRGEVLEIAAHLVRAKLADFYDDAGKIKPTSDWTEEMKYAAASLKTFEEFTGYGEKRELAGYVREFKLWDKNVALDRLFKHFGMFEKDNKQKTDPISELLKAINERGAKPKFKHRPVG